ncbi:DUF1345 domain-containing protein [Sphingobium sp. AN641]|uniref:DUF1345 domain-containing protein n=1 Tax=Sphingobium sp. AN641 TaxID=3133443 RepID=UPI0030BCE7DF
MTTSAKPFFPWRYGMFLALLSTMAPFALVLPWPEAVMAGFDVAAIAFLLSVIPLIDTHADSIRQHAAANDANRGMMLLLTAIVSFVVLIAVGLATVWEYGGYGGAGIALLLVTLASAWLFSNTIYGLHYAHIFYLPNAQGENSSGLAFPGEDEPAYWDFLYFAFTLGMTFQTSDISITTSTMRRTVILHGLLAFAFNIGVLAFTINVLGG